MKGVIGIIVVLSLLVSFSLSDFVTYVETPECYTSNGGCSFMTPSIWNTSTAPNATSHVIIDTLVPITLFINQTQLTVLSLIFGTNNSQVVDIVVVDSVIMVSESSFMGLLWGGANEDLYVSSLTLTNSSLTSKPQYSAGGILNLYNSTMIGENCVIVNLYSTHSTLECSGTIYTGSFESANNIIMTQAIQTYNMTSTGDDFALLQLNTEPNGFVAINNTYFAVYEIIMNVNSSIDFYDTSVTISSSISIEADNHVGFHTKLPNYAVQVSINSISSVGYSQFIIDDNVVANLTKGSIDTLNLGDGVILRLGDVGISNIENKNTTGSSTIFIYGDTIISDGEFRGTVMAQTKESELEVSGNLNLVMPINYNDTSILYGEGTLTVTGSLSCNTPVTVEHVNLGGSITADLAVLSLDLSTAGSGGSVFGDVFVAGDPILYDVNFGTNFLTVYGNYVQANGEITVTLEAETNKSAFIIATGEIVLAGSHLNVKTEPALKLVESRNWTLAQSSSFNSTTINVTASDLSDTSRSFSVYNINGRIIIGYNHKQSSTSFWMKYRIPLVAGGAAIIVVILIIIIVVVAKSRKRSGYKEINHEKGRK